MLWLAVGLGGAGGAMARHAINQWLHHRMPGSTFPAGIFIINVTGSIAIGVLAGLLASNRVQLSEAARAFIVAGILGGFTTFSAFSLDTLTLVRQGQVLAAALNVAGQVGLSLIGVWLGFKAAH